MAGIEIQSERTAASAEAVVGEDGADGGGRRQCRRRRSPAARPASRASARRSTPCSRPLSEGAREAEEKMRALGVAVGEADGAAAQLVRADRAGAGRRAGPGARRRGPGGQPRPRGDRRGDPGKRRCPGRGEPRARSARRSTRRSREQIAEIGNASHLALATAKAASERLTRQLLTIGETAAAIEERIAEDRAEREAEGRRRSVAAGDADHRRAQFDRDRRLQDPLQRARRRRLGGLSQGRPRRLHAARGAAARIRARRARSSAITRTSPISATR